MIVDLFSENSVINVPNPNTNLINDDAYENNIRTLREFSIGDKLVIEDPDAPRNNCRFGIIKNFEYNMENELVLVVDVIGFLNPWKIHPFNGMIEITKII